MTNQQENTEKTLLQKIADQLLAAQREIDEFVVQIALGKAEAKEEFHHLKTEFRNRVHEFKLLLNEFPKGIVSPELSQKIDELELQLALGKVETVSQFEDQKEKILKALGKIETELKHWIGELESSPTFGHEIEKFKLKLEILRLRFSVKKLEVKDEFKSQMAKARQEIDQATTKARAKLAAGKRKYRDFSDEITLSYDHLKKAIKHL